MRPCVALRGCVAPRGPQKERKGAWGAEGEGASQRRGVGGPGLPGSMLSAGCPGSFPQPSCAPPRDQDIQSATSDESVAAERGSPSTAPCGRVDSTGLIGPALAPLVLSSKTSSTPAHSCAACLASAVTNHSSVLCACWVRVRQFISLVALGKHAKPSTTRDISSPSPTLDVPGRTASSASPSDWSLSDAVGSACSAPSQPSHGTLPSCRIRRCPIESRSVIAPSRPPPLARLHHPILSATLGAPSCYRLTHPVAERVAPLPDRANPASTSRLLRHSRLAPRPGRATTFACPAPREDCCCSGASPVCTLQLVARFSTRV